MTLTPEELHRRARGHQLLGLFLIGLDGVIRWNWVEAIERPEDMDTFPTAAEVLNAAEVVARPRAGDDREDS